MLIFYVIFVNFFVVFGSVKMFIYIVLVGVVIFGLFVMMVKFIEQNVEVFVLIEMLVLVNIVLDVEEIKIQVCFKIKFMFELVKVLEIKFIILFQDFGLINMNFNVDLVMVNMEVMINIIMGNGMQDMMVCFIVCVDFSYLFDVVCDGVEGWVKLVFDLIL